MISNGMFDFWDKFESRKVKKLKGQDQGENGAKENTNKQTKPLTIAQLQSAYYSFVIGICASLTSFASEIMIVKISYI